MEEELPSEIRGGGQPQTGIVTFSYETNHVSFAVSGNPTMFLLYKEDTVYTSSCIMYCLILPSGFSVEARYSLSQGTQTVFPDKASVSIYDGIATITENSGWGFSIGQYRWIAY